MINPSFAKVKEAVIEWIKDEEKNFTCENIMIEPIDVSEDHLYVIFDFGECMAAIVVAEADFAPYRFISFEAAAVVNGIHELVRAWYDEEGTTIEEIIKNLSSAMDFVLDYNNRVLRPNFECIISKAIKQNGN